MLLASFHHGNLRAEGLGSCDGDIDQSAGSMVGLGKLFPKIHLLFYSFIPKFSAYYSLKPAQYSFKPAYYSYIILKLILKTS